MTELETKIASLPAGKTLGAIGYDRTYLVRKTATGYEIEAAWVVPERHDDEYDSCTYHPFRAKNGTPRPPVPWVGRQVITADAAEAATAYAEFKSAVTLRVVPQRGIVIGSVTRRAHKRNEAALGLPTHPGSTIMDITIWAELLTGNMGDGWRDEVEAASVYADFLRERLAPALSEAYPDDTITIEIDIQRASGASRAWRVMIADEDVATYQKEQDILSLVRSIAEKAWDSFGESDLAKDLWATE